eukprot:scaffold651330_cov53-Prasinocladus_malaysianus.AAC.1
MGAQWPYRCPQAADLRFMPRLRGAYSWTRSWPCGRVKRPQPNSRVFWRLRWRPRVASLRQWQ